MLVWGTWYYNTCHVLYQERARLIETLPYDFSLQIAYWDHLQINWRPDPSPVLSRYFPSDDTTTYLSDVSPTILEFSFNKDPQTLSSWLESNHLKVNSTKTLALSVGPCDYDYSLFLNDARIEFLKSIKILGVNLDKDLSYKEHISDQLKKV